MKRLVNQNDYLNVLHLISSAAFFGAERVVCELSSYLSKYSYVRVTIGVFVNNYKVIEDFESAVKNRNVIVIPFDGEKAFSWSVVRHIAKVINKYQIKIIHSHGYKSDIYAFLAKKMLSSEIKLFATNHNWIGQGLKERFYQFLDSRVLRNFDSVIAVSELVQNEMIRTGIPSRLIDIIDNGVDVEQQYCAISKQEARNSLHLEANDFVIGCVARLTQEKAHVDLLKAIASASLRHENIKLVLVGDGPERHYLEMMCRQLDIDSRVLFLGNRSDARALYTVFDVFALVSKNEGLPMALLEAMAFSLPVVVSRVGAVPTVIEHEKNGMLVAPADIEAIAIGLSKCRSEPEFARKMGKRAYETIVSDYSSKQMAQRYELLYRASAL